MWLNFFKSIELPQAIISWKLRKSTNFPAIRSIFVAFFSIWPLLVVILRKHCEKLWYGQRHYSRWHCDRPISTELINFFTFYGPVFPPAKHGILLTVNTPTARFIWFDLWLRFFDMFYFCAPPLLVFVWRSLRVIMTNNRFIICALL